MVFKMSFLTNSHRFCYWLSKIKLSRILILLLFILVMAPLFAHYFLSQIEKNLPSDTHKTKLKLDGVDDFTSQYKILDLKKRINDMLRIKGSVSQELRDLESKRLDMILEINGFISKIELIKQDIGHHQDKLDKLKTSISQAQLAHAEVLQQNTPQLYPPIQLKASSYPTNTHIPSNGVHCISISDCFDYSRCSITSGFPIYLYNPEEYYPEWKLSSFLKTTVLQAFRYNPHFTSNPREACMYVVLLGESDHLQQNVQHLRQLPYWGGDGRNHLLLILSRNNMISNNTTLVSPSKYTGRSMIAQTIWTRSLFRSKFDFIIPPTLGQPGGDIWSESPYLLPARRKYLLSYQEQRRNGGEERKRNERIDKEGTYHTENDDDDSEDEGAHIFTKYITSSTSDEFYFDWDCSTSKLCYTEIKRSEILQKSTFVMIYNYLEQGNIENENDNDYRNIGNETNDSIYNNKNDRYISTIEIQMRLYEALKYGAVPVILGGDNLRLPYDEVLDWKKVAIILPIARISELHLFLRSISDEDIVSFRHQGRQLFTKYLSTLQVQIDTLISILRNRLNIPPRPVISSISTSVFREDFKPLKMDPVIAEAEPEENLGPLEPSYPSLSFRRNNTLYLVQEYEVWNKHFNPFFLYPHLPFDPTLPSDAKFIGSDFGFRPINKGAGGAGKEFSENLGSNKQREQFTIVILTYERDQILMNSLSRLNNLPYLNKVLVIWNSMKPPNEDLKWPDIGVPVQVIKTTSNNLNNRFKPYDSIETEAVLNLDDDVFLRHDEIMFAFRVWREKRDRIVGFPGRYHAWDSNNINGGWLYNSNYSCELSMVLTGAAFVHKYYLYEYTQTMPQAIRDKVEEYMNCEDIAMNFLVSHLTRKPPVKVTSRWTFRCPGCPVTLSEDDTHFQERHKCIQFFSKVYGYNPLLYTQFRADSILFKTRIPHDKQKCFKFI